MFKAWGIRQMIAGMVLFSAVVGMVTVAAALAMSVPIWMALAAYPAVCSLTLLMTAALMTVRNRQTARPDILHSQA